MKATEITHLDLIRPLKVGPAQPDFLQATKGYKMMLVDNVKIRVEHVTSGDVVWTTIFGAVGWKQADHVAEPTIKLKPEQEGKAAIGEPKAQQIPEAAVPAVKKTTQKTTKKKAS